MQAPNPPTKPKSNRPSRTYQGSDAQMLTTCLVQTENFIPVQAALADRRKKITPQYLTDTRTLITDAIKNQLGLDPRTLVQELTGQLTTAQTSILGLLKSFYLDLRDAFAEAPDKSRLSQLSAQLGLKDHYAAAQDRNQQALTELLARFCAATDTPALRTELEDTLEISATLINDLRAQREFYTLDATQEQGKSQTPAITDDTIRTFNAIYRRVQAIARLARDIFKANAAEADKYSFSHIRRRMTGGTPSSPTPPVPTP